MTSKPFPRTITLEGGTVAKVDEVCYSLGRTYWRVVFDTKQGQRGCIADWTERGFAEISREELMHTIRRQPTENHTLDGSADNA